jgi:hypothetical protein
MGGYREAFRELGLEIEAVEIKREMAEFDGFEQLRNWAHSLVGTELLAEECLLAMEKRGLLQSSDGKIRFPTRKLVACLKKRPELSQKRP